MGDPRYCEVSEWLIEEAELLDNRRFEEWLARVADEVSYRMPVNPTIDTVDDNTMREPTFYYLDENYESLWVRVQRLVEGMAQSESPSSRTRRHVSNIRAATAGADELAASSYLLLVRSRGDSAKYETVSCERHDRLRRNDDGDLVLASREIIVDQSVLGVLNLSVFL